MSSDTPYGETVVPAGDLTDPDATHDESARRYERGQEIGEGTFGVVYKTTHPYLKRTVALKVLKQQCQASLATVERFKREAGAQDGLHGPNFCQVFDLYQEHGQWHLAIEFIDGPTLERRIKDGLEVDEAVEIVAKLARAMQLAHDEDIVHRDLKPANVMFRPADGSGSHNVPVIMDFGLCRCDDGHNLTADGAFLGTPAYMSPEQARGETESIGPHSDQFGLAVILYEMLCGHLPFQAKPISALLRQICDEDPPAPWRNDQPLAAKLSAALLTALHKEPDQRHGCMADFALALEDCLPRPSRPAVRTRRPAAVCHNLPFRSLGPLFKGRDAALMALREKLDQAAGHATAIVAAQLIHGLGGVGKSRLAVEFAWQHQAHYSALLFVTADSSGNLQAGLAGLCDILQLPEREATDQHTLLAAVLNWLADHSDWLLILDNVDDQHAALAVQEFVADLDGGDVLITGRWTAFGHSIQTMELGVLDDSEAAAYLLDVTVDRRKATDSDADDALALATRLDCLAVALEHAGAYIGRHRCSITDYQQAWEENIHDTADWYDPLTQNYPHSVLAAWVTTVDKLSPAARALLDRLSWLATEPLPACLLDDSRDAANELVDYSMLKWSPESDTWQMHRVVQEVTRSRIPAADRRESLQATLQAVNAVAPIDSYDVRTWDVWNPLRPHVTRIIIHVDQHDIPEPRSTLMAKLGSLLSAKALYAEAEPLMRRTLSIDEQSFGTEHPDVAKDLNNLAHLLHLTNHLAEAEPLMRRALIIDEQSFGTEHSKVAIPLNNLAALLQATNRLAEAEPLMRRALSIDEQSFGTEHPDVARDLNNLALLLQATNRRAEAEPLMRRALSIDEQSFGTEHPDVARDLNNLAQLLQATNRLAEAEPLSRRVVTIIEKSLGESHPNVATALNTLAQLLKASNRLAEAEPLMSRAVTINEKSLGESHPNVASALNNLAQLLQATNRLAEAEPLSRRMVEILLKFTQDTGHEHSNLQAACGNYAGILQDTGLSKPEAEQRIADLRTKYGLAED